MTRSLALFSLLLAGACAGPSTSPSSSSNALPWGNDDPLAGSSGNAPPDLLTPVPVYAYDMAQPAFPTQGPGGGTVPPGQSGCHGYAACYGNCNNAQTQAQYTQCANSCDAVASTIAVQYLNAAFGCAINACISAGRCSSQSDGSDNCVTCAYDAIAGIFGFSCNGDPVCNVASCGTQMSACAASLP